MSLLLRGRIIHHVFRPPLPGLVLPLVATSGMLPSDAFSCKIPTVAPRTCQGLLFYRVFTGSSDTIDGKNVQRTFAKHLKYCSPIRNVEHLISLRLNLLWLRRAHINLFFRKIIDKRMCTFATDIRYNNSHARRLTDFLVSSISRMPFRNNFLIIRYSNL